MINVEIDGSIGVARLNRPEAMNALSRKLMEDLLKALEDYDRDPALRCLIVTGGEKVFAAGADIKELETAAVIDEARDAYLAHWDRVGRVKKPLIAAVSGFALGGGLELAMACDFIVASETASFGQPEINIGVIPGAGGTQRLTRLVGKSLAMEMVLTGRRLSAREALACGLINAVYPVESFLDEAKKLAREVAEKPPLAAKAAKEAILSALDLELGHGLAYERELFNALFATEDQKEGMKAFIEKRKPVFTGK